MTVNAAALPNCFSDQSSHIIINQDGQPCMYRLNFFIQFSLMLSHVRSFLNFVLSHIPWNMITIVVHVLMINDQQDGCSKLKWRRFVCADIYILLTCVRSLSLATIVQLLSLRLRWKINILINRQKSSCCCNYSPFMPIQYVARFSSHYPHHIACLLAVHKRCLLFSISKCSGVDFLLVPFFSDCFLCCLCSHFTDCYEPFKINEAAKITTIKDLSWPCYNIIKITVTALCIKNLALYTVVCEWVRQRKNLNWKKIRKIPLPFSLAFFLPFPPQKLT